MAEQEKARYAWRDLATVPSILSLSRAPLAVLFVIAFDEPRLAFAVLILSGITDLLDGWYARRYSQCTATGALVDGATDKVFVLAVALTLLRSGLLSLHEALLLGVRDAGEVLVTAWVALRKDDHALHEEQRANVFGKLTTLAQFAAVGSAVLRLRHFELCGIAAALGAAAVVSYARRAN